MRPLRSSSPASSLNIAWIEAPSRSDSTVSKALACTWVFVEVARVLGDVPDRAEQHRDQWVHRVGAVRRCRQPDPARYVRGGDRGFRGWGSDEVAFVDDDQAVVVEQTAGGVAAGEGLQHDDVDGVSAAVFAGSERAHRRVSEVEELSESLGPLSDEFGAVDDDGAPLLVAGDQGAGHDGLTETGRCLQDAERVCTHGVDRPTLLVGQDAGEPGLDARWLRCHVLDDELTSGAGDQVRDLVRKAAWHGDAVRHGGVESADQPWFVPGGEALGLLAEELRVEERRAVLDRSE